MVKYRMDNTSSTARHLSAPLAHFSINGIQVIRGKNEVARNPSHYAQNLRVSYYDLSASTTGIHIKIQKPFYFLRVHRDSDFKTVHKENIRNLLG